MFHYVMYLSTFVGVYFFQGLYNFPMKHSLSSTVFSCVEIFFFYNKEIN